jgi:hypothetical protein
MLLLLPTTSGLVAFDWRVLADSRHATRIEYPADLFSVAEETADGIILAGPDARLEMSAMTVAGVTTAADLRVLIEGNEGYESMTYSPGGNRWLVVSGYRGPDIYYEKFLIGRDKIRGFSVQYPTVKRVLYDPIVEKLEDSFGVTAPPS